MFTVSPIPGLRRRLRTRLIDETLARSHASAIVFAPHQDDETLGCGGTMIRKSRAAAALECVFMTDGATSHQRYMDRSELSEMRRVEALAATAILGLSASHVHFLDFPDGRLGASHTPAVDRVEELLRRSQPEEVYVPYRRDGTPDHIATFAIVSDAVRRVGRPTQILEYPVWFWNRWPWVSLKLELGRDTLRTVSEVIDARFGFELMAEFRSGVFVGDVIETKRLALAQHRSQMTVLRPGTKWPTLPQISGGEFLDCLFQEFEVFRCLPS